MKIVSSSDWRSSLPFETPTLLSEVMPGEDANCFICGAGADPRPRTELWAVKHRHPKNHDGYVRFYCLEHRPAVAAPPAPTVAAAGTGRSRSASRPAAERRTAAPRRTPAPEKPRAVCPNCFVEVAASGVCGLCGEKIA